MVPGIGKLLIGGIGSVGITTGLVFLVVPYLKPEESSTSAAMVLANEDEEIIPLEPTADESKEESTDKEEGEDTDNEEQQDSNNSLPPEQPNQNDSEDSKDQGEDGDGDGDDSEENEISEDTQESGEVKLPGSSSGGKTKVIRLKFNRKNNVRTSIERLTKAFKFLLPKRS